MTAGCNCGRQWRGLTQAHCTGTTGCHAHFSSVDGFDRHRRGTGGCHDPATMVDKQGVLVYKPTETRFGTTWVRDRPDAHPRSVVQRDQEGAA
jgi:hypothetical protein